MTDPNGSHRERPADAPARRRHCHVERDYVPGGDDFANAEIEFASSSTIKVCEP
jgi:hypothetical protein